MTEPADKFAYPPWTYRGYADRMGLPMARVLRLAQLRRLPGEIGRVKDSDVRISLKEYAALQGVHPDIATKLYRWGLTSREVVRVIAKKKKLNPPPGQVNREEIKLTLHLMRRVRRQISTGKKAIRLHVWKARGCWKAFQNFHNREMATLARMRQRLIVIDRTLYDRQAVLDRLVRDAEIGRIMENEKTFDDMVRKVYGEKEYQYLKKRQASDKKRSLAHKLRAANKKAKMQCS